MSLKKFDEALRILSTSHRDEEMMTKRSPVGKVPKRSLNRESGLWGLLHAGMKKTGRRIEHTRLESWAVPGVPDVLLCSEAGIFSMLELKALPTKSQLSKPLHLSPHQCAFASRHAHAPVFIVVRDSNFELLVFDSSSAVDLRLDGCAAVEALQIFSPTHSQGTAYDWDAFFRLTSPVA